MPAVSMMILRSMVVVVSILLFKRTDSMAFLAPTSSSSQRTFGLIASKLHSVDIDTLMDMDVVIYTLKNDPDTEKIGAVQEDGNLSPLSVWSDEPVFGESLEFLVDEEDRFPGLTKDDCIVHRLVPQESLSYGSRQVGGGKGPGNPHGEESELLYYVEEKIISNLKLSVKPELEILW